MMLLYPVILIILLLSVFSATSDIKIEWSLGSLLPISKVLDSGASQDLFCSVSTDKPSHSIMLLCPLNVGMCLRDCSKTEHISCKKIIIFGRTTYQYTFTVFKYFEGTWKCQYGARSSRNLRLTVTNKPYIKSLSMYPNPAWKGSSLNITCEVMPTDGISAIQFQRVLEDNSSTTISDNEYHEIDKSSKSIIIKPATPGQDDKIQCTVYTISGIITTKVLKTNIYYFPTKISLTATTTEEKRHEVGSSLSFQCLTDGGNPHPILKIFRKRLSDYPRQLSDQNVVLAKEDNNAIFYCTIQSVAGQKSDLKSNFFKVIVDYPPEKIELTEDPKDQIMESQTKSFVCFSNGSSEPKSVIEWTMIDSLGRRIQPDEVQRILETDANDYKRDENFILKSTVRMMMLRNYNGYKITCSVIYKKKQTQSQTKTIEVIFVPTYVALNANPLGGISEGDSMSLTCSTGSANPPSKIQWQKIEPGKMAEDITSYSTVDTVPANYSGVAIYSALSIHGVGRLNHGTLYKCVVSHAIFTNKISKEYFLNVLFPPVVQVFSYPKQVEEGEKVHLQCQTSGGNPANILQYNFQWQFCPVNISYQSPSDSEIFDKPSSAIRNSCSELTDGFNFHQNPSLNLTTISGKDRGWYSCHVRSPGGTSVGYIFIDVFYSPILTHQTPYRIYAKPGSNIIMNAYLSSNPSKVEIKWYFREKRSSRSYEFENQNSNFQFFPNEKQIINMKTFSRLKYSLLENFTIHLSIKSLTPSDYGDYFCEVKNRLGKKSIEFQICPSDDISISESNIRLRFNGRKVVVSYDPPSQGHFSHLVLRICPIQETDRCKDMQISNPHSGHAAITLTKSPDLFTYRLLVFNGSNLLQITNTLQKDMALQPGHWVEMSIEMMIAVIIGVVGILVLLFVALLTLILLKCRRKKPKGNYPENNSVATSNSHQRRQDYMLINNTPNTSLLKNGCHCFSNYPLELRSDNGSDHSVPSQNVYQHMMMRRKIRDNGEMSSIHSGGSCHSPDVVLTERTSINSTSNQMINGNAYPYSMGNGSTKVTLLNGRLHSIDGQNMPEDFIPQEMIFAAVDDGLNLSQARAFPILKNLSSDYPIYFQLNNSMVPKAYEIAQPPMYTSQMPHCQNRVECHNQDSRENSSTTNTDSNQDSGAHDPSATEIPTNTLENTRNEN